MPPAMLKPLVSGGLRLVEDIVAVGAITSIRSTRCLLISREKRAEDRVARVHRRPRMYATRPAIAAVRFCVETSGIGSSWMPSSLTVETRQVAS